MYPNFQMTVVGIDSIISNKGLYSTLVAGVPETWTISGFGFSDKDKLKLVRGTDCSSETVVEETVYGSNPIEAYVKDLMVPTAEEGTLTVCWKFEDDEYYYYVKAVPKAVVSGTNKQVKRFSGKDEKERLTKKRFAEEMDIDEELLD